MHDLNTYGLCPIPLDVLNSIEPIEEGGAVTQQECSVSEQHRLPMPHRPVPVSHGELMKLRVFSKYVNVYMENIYHISRHIYEFCVA